MISLSQGEKNLESLISSLSQDTDFNESQTRFHIIDKVLFECLGWSKDDEVEVEEQEERKFTDYELGKPRLAIVEAKREGRVFELPAGISTKRVTDLPSITRISSEASEAINQAQSYCSRRGVPIAIVTNGHQYIVFLASRQDGLSVMEGNAVVFDGLNDLKEKFDLAWQLIFSAGIKEKNIFRYLSSGNIGIPNKLSSKLTGYPTSRYSSEILMSGSYR